MAKYKELERSSSEDDMIHLRPILNLMKMTFSKENNLLHYFATNEFFLNLYYKEIKNLVSEIDDKTALPFVYYVLFSNSENSKLGRRPLTMALK